MKMTKHEFSAATQYQLLLSGDWSGENVFTIPTSKDHISLFEIYTPSQLLWSQCGGAIMATGPGSLAQVEATATVATGSCRHNFACLSISG